jgi:hypothetical protein
MSNDFTSSISILSGCCSSPYNQKKLAFLIFSQLCSDKFIEIGEKCGINSPIGDNK